VSHLKDFRSGNKESESRGQAGCKHTSSDEVVETRHLPQYLFGIILMKSTTHWRCVFKRPALTLTIDL